MKTYKNIIFDLDGTILDTSQGIFSVINETLIEMGYQELDEEVLIKFVGPPVYNSFLNICGMPHHLAEEATKKYRKKYWEVGMYQASIYEGMTELLDFLKGKNISLTVATMKREDQAISILNNYNLAHYFDSINGANEAGTLTKADLIYKACVNSNTMLQDSVMIGDTVHDEEAAYMQGVDFIAAVYGFGYPEGVELRGRNIVHVAKAVADISEYFENI